VAKKMLVESDPHQTRVAILESDRLTEIFVERKDHRGVVGNIYKGRVSRVLPGMQAAFVNIGLERDAFLYVSDVGGHEAAPPSEQDDEYLEDDTVKLSLAQVGSFQPDSGSKKPEPESLPIDELLTPGQEIIVQVTKDALPNKGARVTTHVTLPSRDLVLLPTVEHRGLSRRIESEEERQRLEAILDKIGTADGGLIVRTVGEGRSAEDFENAHRYLASLWRRTLEKAGKVNAPTLLHRDLDVALRVVRDMFDQNYDALWVDGEDTYQRIVEFLDEVQPDLVHLVKLDHQESALFERFDVEAEIEAALQTKVWLKSGGYLVINQTEALVAIDVNTGRYVGRQNLEETVLRTNMEAVEEIVRQIRVRDLSGILIIDLIDMTEQAHRDQVHAALEEELRKDRAKSKFTGISEFGLVEVTRKRTHANLSRLLTRPCPYCRGDGRIKTTSTICLNLRQALLKKVHHGRRKKEFLLRVHPEIATALQTQERELFEEMEREVGSPLLVQSDPELHHQKFSISEV
jgi:ribonuclease G